MHHDRIEMEKEKQETTTQKGISFSSLSLQALPKMWTFQTLSGIILAVPALIMFLLIDWVAGIGGVVTSANLKDFLLSWKLPVILGLGFLLVLIYLVFELFAQIYLTDNILHGRKTGLKECIGKGIRSLRKFLNPTGLLIILFIFIAVPLCGVGFSLSLSESFYIPNFIMEVVLKNPIFTAAYILVILFLIWVAFRHVFVLHAVLIDGMTPSEGRKYSVRLVRAHLGPFLKGMILTVLVIIAIIIAASFLCNYLPDYFLGNFGEILPDHHIIDYAKIAETGGVLTITDEMVIIYRIYAAFGVLIGKYLVSIITLLCGAYFMLRLNRYYLEFTGRGRKLWPERPKNTRHTGEIVLFILILLLSIVLAVSVGFGFDFLLKREEPVKIVAHRAGGTMASENSIEGLEKAIEHGCYAAEIDVQRTKDGYYIINHDNDFSRLTGVAKAPQDMTLEEIKQLRIKDTTGNGQELPVATLEEMLDVIKGKIKLFVELKGATADKQMVDDVVRIIREHDCLNDTALISLDYSIIDYAETTYPEFETGTLFFISLGDIAQMNCDLLIMEEETATDINISSIHFADKQAIVWTVNTEEGMYHFLDSEVDAVITDEIPLAEEVQETLDSRTDLEVMKDKLFAE